MITIASKEDQQRWFGNYDYHNKFYPITWGGNEPHWTESNAKAIEEINKRIQPRDFICVIAGWCQKPVADAFPNHINVEYGIGYTGVFADFKVFESYAHMHWVYGKQNDDNGKFFDCVIPNYFDPNDFEYRSEPDDYYFWTVSYTHLEERDLSVNWLVNKAVRLLSHVRSPSGCGSVSYTHLDVYKRQL